MTPHGNSTKVLLKLMLDKDFILKIFIVTDFLQWMRAICGFPVVYIKGSSALCDLKHNKRKHYTSVYETCFT